MPQQAGSIAHAYCQNAAAADGNGTAVDVTGYTNLAFQVTGTFSATVNFEATIDGTNYVALSVWDTPTNTRVTTATAAGLFYVAVGALWQVRARISGYASGTVTVLARAST